MIVQNKASRYADGLAKKKKKQKTKKIAPLSICNFTLWINRSDDYSVKGGKSKQAPRTSIIRQMLYEQNTWST
jgi:hypothetical protein